MRGVVTLHLVRHGRSAQRPDLASWEWTLTDDAAAGVHRLRDSGVLPAEARWTSSTEPKAIATAALLTSSEVPTSDALREALRDPEWLDAERFHELVLASFDQPDRSVRPGWEPLATTRDRVVEAANEAVDSAAGRDVVLVGHGTAWTMLVAGLTGEPPDVAAWASMRMPDHCAIEWPGRLSVAWGAWTP